MKNKAIMIDWCAFRNLFFVMLMFLFAVSDDVLAQDSDSLAPEKINPMVRLAVVKNDDGSRTLTGTFAYRDKETREVMQKEGMSLRFITGADSLMEIGTVNTDINGKAICQVPADYKYSKNEEGYIHFGLEFDGDEEFETNSAEVDLIDLQIKLTLEVIDSVRTVNVMVAKIMNGDELVPLNEETIPIYVGRMFSHLKVGEIDLVEGEGSFEFPSEIPGDTLGMITIIAKFDDHEEYATVMKSEKIDWGAKTYHHTVYHPRSLWTNVAPVWMIVTLSIMLLGVWGHYFFVIVELIRLKRMKQEKVL